MARDPDVVVFRIGGIPVAAIDMDGLVRSVGDYLRRAPGEPGAVVNFCGAHGIVEAQRDAALRRAYEDAWLNAPDGRPLFWLGWLRRQRVRQVPGIEAVERLCRAGLADGWSHYFLGGGAGVAQQLAAEMAARVPGLRVAGSETPPFRPLRPDEVEALRARIRASRATIIWVGLGAPKQEIFMATHAPHLPGTVAMGVGAAFDVNTGRMPRAPRVLQICGLEWAFRLLLEPRRLWSRYSVVLPRFLAIAALSLLRAEQDRPPGQPAPRGDASRPGPGEQTSTAARADPRTPVPTARTLDRTVSTQPAPETAGGPPE